MAAALSPSTRNIDVQLRVASNHLTDIYLDIVNDLKTEQLQLIDEDTYVPQLIDDMTSIVGDSVPYVCNMVFPRKGSNKVNTEYLSTIYTWQIYIINIYIQFDTLTFT